MPTIDGAVISDTPAVVTEKPGVSTETPGTSGAATVAESETDLFPKVFESKPNAPAEVKDEEFKPDLTGLSPEQVAKVEEIRRGFQSLETRKLQKLADDRRTWEEERKTQADKILEMVDRLTKAQKATEPVTETPSGEPDLMAQMRELQENGQVDEANKLLLKILEDKTNSALEPLRKERAVEARINTFIQTKDAVFEADPAVKRYKDDVVKIWDDPDNVVMRMIKPEVLSSPERIQKFVPVIMRAIAMERHAQTLEANYDKAVKAGVERELKKMKGLPEKLVETGGGSKETRAETSDRRAAVLRALDKLQNGQAN